MARKYHSPSSVDLGRRCPRAWWYRYVENIRPPEITWSEDLKGRDRSKALGTALHLTLEKHYEGQGPDWLWYPGQVAATGLKHLPGISDALAIERGIGKRTGRSIGPGHDGAERFVIDVAGVPWLGYRDLTDYSATVTAGGFDKPALYDYKSTKSISNYAKTVVELVSDFQANLYAYDTMVELQVDRVWCRWVYFETDLKTVRRGGKSEPRDFVIERPAALVVIESAAEIAKQLDAYDQIDQAPMNPSACPDFGGCEFHVKNGGPCSAHVPVGALIQARVPKKKEGSKMPLDKSKLAAHMAGQTNAATNPPAETPPALTDPTTADTSAGTPVTEPTTASATTSPIRRPGRPAGKAAKGGTFADLASALTEAESAHAEASASLEAAKENMRKALA